MLTPSERELLAGVDAQALWDDTARLAQFDRRSGRKGESDGLDVIEARLTAAGIDWQRHCFDAWISDPIRGALTVEPNGERFVCKTWSFAAPGRARGEARWVDPDELASHPLTWLADRGTNDRDLEGLVVVTPTSSVVAVNDAADRGAVAVVSVWSQGDEPLIHEGNVNMVWGQPEPTERSLYPKIPVIFLNRPEGRRLGRLVEDTRVILGVEAELDVGRRSIPVLEARLDGPSDEFILLGSHIDSWHQGACDNATGNAVVLGTVEALRDRPRRRGLRACWWSGHSNGRYAGSSAYASRFYADLSSHCVALCNADMPGMVGATDFGRGSSGPDLEPLYGRVVADVTGQRLRPSGVVTGWDLSFKNIGVSSCMSWSSTLPDRSAHGTAGGFMSWWWHTEDDLMSHVDRDVLAQDGRIYRLALDRLINRPHITEPARLAGALGRALARHDGTNELRRLLEGAVSRGLGDDLEISRRLNRALFAFKAPWLQDWAIQLGPVPGLWLTDSATPRSDAGRLAVAAMRESQMNRLWELLSGL